MEASSLSLGRKLHSSVFVPGYSASQAAFRAIEDINRVIGDNFSSQDWFSCKEPETPPVRLPWEALTDEERGFERSACPTQ